MAKTSKRERKFQATGGVKRRLEKGTVTNKGKLRKRRKEKAHDGESSPSDRQANPRTKRTNVSNDFLGGDNLADLDIESFFAKVADETTKTLEKEDDSDQRVDRNRDDSSSRSSENENDAPNQEETPSSSEEGSDGSDDEDINAAEARMKAEMAKMSEADPEFHDFLQENEKGLLDFGHDIDTAEDADEAEVDAPKSSGNSADKIHLTQKVLDTIEKGAFKSHSVKSLKKLIAAYKAACHLADASGANEGESRPGESGSLFVIDSSKIFDKLMVMSLSRCHELFSYHLKCAPKGSKDKETDDADEDNKALDQKALEGAQKWTEIKPIVQSFFRSTLHVLSEAKEPELLTFILKSLAKYVPFLAALPRIAEAMLKSLTGLWSAPLDTSEDYQVVRLNAFFRIRQLALTQPFPFIEDVLKKTYLAYAKRARFGTASSVTSVLPTLTFMGNCLCELYSLDHHSSYQHCFVYIRQLALLLRSATHKKTREAMQQVYCWQYIHCLKLWVAVLSDSVSGEQDKDSSLMRSLIYPLAEVILGTVRFVPSPARHLPLRLHCVRLLQQLAAASEAYIPATSLLLECFDWKEWYMAPKKSGKSSGAKGGLQLDLVIKLLPKEDALRTHEQREAGINALMLLLNREVELYRYSPGFPEFSIRIVQRLRQFVKEAPSQPRWRSLAKSCIETCDLYSKNAVQARSQLKEAPKDVKGLECLKPSSEKNMRERHEESLKREQLQKQHMSGIASTSSTKESSADDADTGKSSKPRKKKSRKAKKEKVVREEGVAAAAADAGMLEQDDEVEEGVNWSDSE